MSSISAQLRDGIRYEGPSNDANHISARPQVVDMSKGSLKSVGAIVLDHPQRGAPSIDVVHMEHIPSLKKIPPTWQGIPPHRSTSLARPPCTTHPSELRSPMHAREAGD
jgi:hypothetical protein